MANSRLCEICHLEKPVLLFARGSGICKVCNISIGVQETNMRKKRVTTSKINNKMCKKFLQQHTIMPKVWEMTLL
jgi:hypothetical protein